MKLKIKNISKFIRSILIILGIIICVGLFITNKSFSHTEANYKTIYVARGDSLWSIAKEEQEINNYYKNKDVRYIINNLKKVNKLSNNDLSVNQKLIVPEI